MTDPASNHKAISAAEEKMLLEQAANTYDAAQHMSVEQVQNALQARLSEIEKTADIPSALLHFRLS
ncbi:MAG: hypothetical protein DPW14_09670 [Planctomycetes bacterium]|nr:hypothetical protein [Planctomycetota bacterium]